MIDRSTFDFLKGLREHDNDKVWFEDHREDYETAKDNMTDVADAIIASTARFDPDFARVNDDPARCVARIHRDMRFNDGERPRYKDFWYIMLKSPSAASYYVQVKPGDTFAGGGAFNPQRDDLAAMRTRIHERFGQWQRVVESPRVRETFPHGLIGPEPLKIAPKGYDPEDPAIEYLRMKGWCANRPLTAEQVQGPDALETIVETYQVIEPMVTFLNAARA